MLRALLPLLAAAPLLAQASLDLASRPYRGCQLSPIGADGNFTGARWPNGRVPYAFAANVTPAMQAAILPAMQAIRSTINVSFVPRVNETDYVLIRDSVINSTPVGKLGGAQVLQVFNWNVTYEMVHGLMHVLGYWHEHQRPDRDTYVQVQTANVDPTRATDFEIVPTGQTQNRAYDFDSVMHFSATEGGLNGATALVVLPPNGAQQSAIGQRTHLSNGDLEALRLVYGSSTAPVLQSLAPQQVTAYLPGSITITGQLLDEVLRIVVDGVASTTFTLLSPTQIRFNVINNSLIGPHTVAVESAVGRSNTISFSIRGNDPPVLEIPIALVRNLTALLRLHSDNVRTNILLAAFDNSPSAIPGVVTLGLGSQFTTAFPLLTGIGAGNGIMATNLTVPTYIPAGARLWFQSIVYDPANLTTPITVSNLVESRIY